MTKNIKEKQFVIYRVSNTINGKVYIGITNEFKRRLKEHKYHSKSGSGLLYRSIRKYGIENFKFEVIEICKDLNETRLREIFWINEYKSFDRGFGYNLTTGGEDISFREESIDKMRNATYAVKPYGKNKKYKGVYKDCETYCYRFEIDKKIYNKGGYRTEHEAAWGRDIAMREMLPNFTPFLNFPIGKTTELIKEQIATNKLIESVKYSHGKIIYCTIDKVYYITARDIIGNRIFTIARARTIGKCEQLLADFIERNKSIFMPKKSSTTSIQKSWEEAFGSIYDLFTEDYLNEICSSEIGVLI